MGTQQRVQLRVEIGAELKLMADHCIGISDTSLLSSMAKRVRNFSKRFRQQPRYIIGKLPAPTSIPSGGDTKDAMDTSDNESDGHEPEPPAHAARSPNWEPNSPGYFRRYDAEEDDGDIFRRYDDEQAALMAAAVPDNAAADHATAAHALIVADNDDGGLIVVD